jgi:hypothetical protein
LSAYGSSHQATPFGQFAAVWNRGAAATRVQHRARAHTKGSIKGGGEVCVPTVAHPLKALRDRPTGEAHCNALREQSGPL